MYQDLCSIQVLTRNQVKGIFTQFYLRFYCFSMYYYFAWIRQKRDVSKRKFLHKIYFPEIQVSSLTVSFEQRDFVIRELLDTEANYLDVLNALKYKFMQPLEKLLSKEEIKIIFNKIKELADVHNKFLERLREATSPGSRLKLSQVFLDFREQFLIYGEYCSNMTLATDTLKDACKRNSSVEQSILVSFLRARSKLQIFKRFICLCSNAKKNIVEEEFNYVIFYPFQCREF